MADSESSDASDAHPDPDDGASSEASPPDAPQDDEPTREEVSDDRPPSGARIEASNLEKIAAVVVLFLMLTTMAYLLWIVVRYWGQVQV